MAKKKTATEEVGTSVDDLDSLVEPAEPALGSGLDGVAGEKKEKKLDVTDPGWVDYVLQQFQEDELFDGSPTCDGLRRVAEKVLGPIVQSTPVPVQAPSIENGMVAVVAWQLTIDWKLNGFSEGLRCFGDIADVGPDNCDPAFARFASAVAGTRAEARALRKALRLRRVVALEEKTDVPVADPDGPSMPSQWTLIRSICKRIGISWQKLLQVGKTKYESASEVPYGEAERMFSYVSKLQNQPERIPDSLKA